MILFLGESGELLELERDDIDDAYDEAKKILGEIRWYGAEGFQTHKGRTDG